MDGNVLTTSADELYNLVMSRKKISVEDASKILRLPMNIVQSLVDFLVEEKIFGIEYKFTTPYIYIGQEKGKKVHPRISPIPMQEKKPITKEEFYQKAGNWNIPTGKIDQLWKKYVNENIDYIKEEFYKKAESKNIQNEKIGMLWQKYLSKLQ